jgi:beta-glucosidase-like glycosyl hydrolase/CubicO group peptidase (beta-lactamase class C family)
MYGQSQLSKAEWVDSIMTKMNLDEKLGQLFMIRANSHIDNGDVPKVLQLIKNHQIGGICFFKGSPSKQAELTNQYQKLSKIPLMIGIDGEWGLGMRFPESTMSFPKQLTLGAIRDDSLIEEFGKEVAKHMKRVGIHINFAPVVDVNSNPKNPVINDRSFGEDVNNVSSKSYHYAIGMQKNGVLACAKHFPGHGDTEVDSHYGLPVIRHSMSRLEEIELFPFRTLATKGIASMMVGHLHIPAIDNRANRPTTLSQKAVTDILKNEMGFQGLIFTDAMDMKGVTQFFTSGTGEAEAIAAGVDILLLSESVTLAKLKIKSYIAEGKITQQGIDQSVKKILEAKYTVGLSKYEPVKLEGLMNDINANISKAVKNRLIESSITLVADDENLLPMTENTLGKMATLAIGTTSRNVFQDRLHKFFAFDHYNTTYQINEGVKIALIHNLRKYEKVIIGLHNLPRSRSSNFGLNPSLLSLIAEINKNSKVILCIFGSPQSLRNFENIGTVVVSYEDGDMYRDAAAQALFGVTSIEGRLPMKVSDKYYVNLGIFKPPVNRLGYSIPESVGVDEKLLARMETQINNLMADKSSPGCQVLVAKNGRIIWEKGYGKFKYDNGLPVDEETVYDLASLTKILSTTLAIMKLSEQGLLNINTPLSLYLPELAKTNKANMTAYDILGHVAGLLPWIPFYDETLVQGQKPNTLSSNYYSPVLQDNFMIPVANNIFLRNDYRDTIYQTIYDSELRDNTNYRYSDLGLYILAKVVERVSGQRIDKYMDENFYVPLRLRYMGYNPINRISLDNIAPTEIDNYWRKQEVHGMVHDMGAAMLGGVAGHAGLFSNSRDIAVLMQMLLNGGTYGKRRYLKAETIKTFTTRHLKSARRGIGFDMKELNPARKLNMSELAPESTFGHTGFTGTAVYADPQNNIIYVFLSNRTYPSMNNNRLNAKDYRTKIQDYIYQALIPNV